MTKTIKEERLRWVLPIIEKKVRLVDSEKVYPHGKRSLEHWVAAYRKHGEAGLEPKTTEPKTQPNETSIAIKERVIEIRKKTKKCALKIHWQLEKEGIEINERTIGNGSIFTNYYVGTNKRSDLTVKTLHALDVFCQQNNIIHYLIDPGKPAQNGTVERSHREDQEKFYDVHKFKTVMQLRDGIVKWNTYYNNLEHCGLGGKTPNEFLADYSKTNPPNVCT